MTEIVRTEDTLGGEPRIEGTRIGVLHVYELVVEGDHSPVDIADQLDISLGEVYSALAYYYEHLDEMQAVRRERDGDEQSLSDVALSPPEPAQ